MRMQITGNLSIPQTELVLTFSRSSGPGGQNVNKLNTRVTLSFDVAGSPSLDERSRQLIASRLASRINRNGILRLSSETCRTQQGNREAVVKRFIRLLREALREKKMRRKTKIPRRAHERRLSAKKNRGRIKQLRRKRVREE